ncbi:MAG: hypothetical protein HQL22_11570 [Candidatus Omnitrophica bacterium]|nr:hypothetical protein [Candidatus Omnitrophota bacterium]
MMKSEAGRIFRDYVIDIGCWIIDVFFKAVTFVISGAIVLFGTVVMFVVELIIKIVLGAVMLWLTCWFFLWIFKICWMIWGPRDAQF